MLSLIFHFLFLLSCLPTVSVLLYLRLQVPGKEKQMFFKNVYETSVFKVHINGTQTLLHLQLTWNYIYMSSRICLGKSLSMGIGNPLVSALKPFQSCQWPHSSTLAWKIPRTEDPGRLQSMESLRVRHDWMTSLSLFTFMHWRRKWQPTPVFLPGEPQGWGSLVGCCLWGRTESDTTEVT